MEAALAKADKKDREIVERIDKVRDRPAKPPDASDGEAPPRVTPKAREAYLEYLRERELGVRPPKAIATVNSRGRRHTLKCVWEMLGMQHPVEGVRTASFTSSSCIDAPHWRRYPARTISGTPCETLFSRTDRLQLIMRAIDREIDVLHLANKGYIVDILPTPDAKNPSGAPSKKAVGDVEEGVRAAGWLSHCRLGDGCDDTRDTYGQAIGIYFGFLRHLTRWLIPIAVFGVIVQVAGSIWQERIAELLIAYSLFLGLWAPLWLGSWKHAQDRLLLQWGILSSDRGHCGFFASNPFRMKFKGVRRRSPVTGKDEEAHQFPIGRFCCYAASVLASKLLTIGQLLLVCYVSALRVRIHVYTRVAALDYNFSQHVITIANAAQIFMMNTILRNVAMYLTKLENHKTHTTFVDYYTVKAIWLQLVNSFASLFYTAFFTDFADEYIAPGVLRLCEEDAKRRSGALTLIWWKFSDRNCALTMLNEQLASLLCVFMFKNITELGVPYAQRILAQRIRVLPPGPRFPSKVKPLSPDCDSGSPSSAGYPGESPRDSNRVVIDAVRRLDAAMVAPRFGGPDYGSNGPISDYSELAVMIGFLLLFSVTFPPAGLLVLISCYLESHVDALKFTRILRRPLPWPVTSTGVWGLIFEVMVWVSMATNAALLVFTAKLGKYPLVRQLLGENYAGSDLVPWGILCLVFVGERKLARCFHWRRPWSLNTVEMRMLRALHSASSGQAACARAAPADGGGVGGDVGQRRQRFRCTDYRVRWPHAEPRLGDARNR